MKTIELNEDKNRYILSWLEYGISINKIDLKRDIGKEFCFKIVEEKKYTLFYGILVNINSCKGKDLYRVTSYKQYTILKHNPNKKSTRNLPYFDSQSYFWYGVKTRNKNEWLDPNWRRRIEIGLFL